MTRNNGYKLYNDETSLFSWHETFDEAEQRSMFELRTFGREFRIAAVTDSEWVAYGHKLAESV